MNARLEVRAGLGRDRRMAAKKPRAKRAKNLESLKDGVRALCLSEFRDTFNMEWPSGLERYVNTDCNDELDDSLEIEVRKRFVGLNNTVQELLDLLQKADDDSRGPLFHGPFTQLLQHLGARRMFDPLLPFLRNKPSSSKNNSRSLFVHRWDYLNPLGLPARNSGTSRLFNTREFAIVSLLGGHWPGAFPDGNASEPEIIQAEMDLLRPIIQEHGVQQFRLVEGRLFCDRGLRHNLAVFQVALSENDGLFVPIRGPDVPRETK